MDQTKKVLIVEDENSMLWSLKESLNDAGIVTLEAKDGEEGLKVALENHPDLVLLDLLLPKMSGQNFLKNLRADEWGKTARVIVLTNLGSEEVEQEVRDLGIDEFLAKKDWSLENVVGMVKSKLGM